MIEPFMTSDIGIDLLKLATIQANFFFLAFGVVAGFSEELAINLLGRAAGAFDNRGDR